MCCFLKPLVYDFGIIFELFLHILVSSWYKFGVLGILFATLGPPGAPREGRGEKVAEKVVCGSFVCSPLGSFLEPKSLQIFKKSSREPH